MSGRSICYFARIPDKELFGRIDFYSNDIKILKELGYDVKLCNDYFNIPNCDLYFIWWWSSGIIPLLKAKINKKPSIMIGNIHFSDPSSQGYKFRPLHVKSFIKYSLRNSDLQIATSKIELEDIMRFNPSNPVLVYHAIDNEKYKFCDEPRDKIIFTVSRLLKLNVERKKILETLEAFKIFLEEFPEYKFIIAGRKEDDGYHLVKNKIDELGLNQAVELRGSINDEEKINLFHKSMIYVQPTSYEGFGLAIAESMLCGTPVITSFKGAVPEVTGDFALNVNPDSVREIYAGFKKLVTDKDYYNLLKNKGSERIKQKFSIENRKRQIGDLIKSLS